MKKLSVIHKEQCTKIYDENGVDLTERLHIEHITIDFDAYERKPKLTITACADEIEIRMDEFEGVLKKSMVTKRHEG